MSARPARQNSLGSLSFSLVGIVGIVAVVMASDHLASADRPGDGG